MMEHKKYRSLVLGGVLGILALAAASRLEAETKNFYFPEVRIDIAVAKDGSFTVDEFRTYEFEGRFSWASLWIPLRADRMTSVHDASVVDFSITDESGAPLRTETSTGGSRFTAKWYYSARSERRTFHIHYLVRGGIISYPDISELYWQAIGSGWDKPTAKAEVTVRLPEAVASQEDIRVFGHGPLSGWAEIADERTARFTASNLPSGQFLEVRVLWPAGMVNGIASTRYSLASIKEEEAGFVRKTIERARRAHEDALNARGRFLKLAALWGAGLLLLPIIWLFIYVRIWKKIGKDYRFEDIPPYARELPSELRPALVQVLLREGRHITPAAFTATLFDAARRGFIEIEDRAIEKRTLFGTKSDLESVATLRREFR
ncbi:MAG TPA: DUF2207 domain-containing protein, partial [Acidobacteriota bacterium]|nr:DUF2207 domain-containing protein [Acidobacteriota bacterium]